MILYSSSPTIEKRTYCSYPNKFLNRKWNSYFLREVKFMKISLEWLECSYFENNVREVFYGKIVFLKSFPDPLWRWRAKEISFWLLAAFVYLPDFVAKSDHKAHFQIIIVILVDLKTSKSALDAESNCKLFILKHVEIVQIDSNLNMALGDHLEKFDIFSLWNRFDLLSSIEIMTRIALFSASQWTEFDESTRRKQSKILYA